MGPLNSPYLNVCVCKEGGGGGENFGEAVGREKGEEGREGGRECVQFTGPR